MWDLGMENRKLFYILGERLQWRTDWFSVPSWTWLHVCVCIRMHVWGINICTHLFSNTLVSLPVALVYCLILTETLKSSLLFFFFKKNVLFARQSYKDGEREKFCIPWFIPQKGYNSQAWATPKPGVLELNPGLPYSGRDPSTQAIFRCLPRCISRKLNWKCSNWDSN